MKSKYDANTFPLIAEKMARDGHNDEEIAAELGIGTSAYYDYQNKHQEFAEAIKRGKKPANTIVENALYKRARGYEVEESHTVVKVLDDGTTKIAEVRTTKKHVPPDVGAIAFWLKNKEPEKWRDRQEVDLNTDKIIKVMYEGDNNKNTEATHKSKENN